MHMLKYSVAVGMLYCICVLCKSRYSIHFLHIDLIVESGISLGNLILWKLGPVRTGLFSRIWQQRLTVYSPAKHRELVFNVCAIAYPLSLRNPTILRLLQIHSIPLCHSLICSSAQAVLQNLLGTRVLFRLRGISEREAVRHEMGDWVRFRDGVPVDDSDDSSGIPMTATAWHVGVTVTDLSQAHDTRPRTQTAEL